MVFEGTSRDLPGVVASRGSERFCPGVPTLRAATDPPFPGSDRLASVSILSPSVADAAAPPEAGADELRDASTLCPARPASPEEEEVGFEEQVFGTATSFAAPAAAGVGASGTTGGNVITSDVTADSLVAFAARPVDDRAPGGADRGGATSSPLSNDGDRSDALPEHRDAGRVVTRCPASCGGGDNLPRSREVPGVPVDPKTAGRPVAATAPAAEADGATAFEDVAADKGGCVVATEPAPFPAAVCALAAPPAEGGDARGTGAVFGGCGSDTKPSTPPFDVGTPGLPDSSTSGLRGDIGGGCGGGGAGCVAALLNAVTALGALAPVDGGFDDDDGGGKAGELVPGTRLGAAPDGSEGRTAGQGARSVGADGQSGRGC